MLGVKKLSSVIAIVTLSTILASCGEGDTSSGGSTVVNYTFSSDGAHVTCKGADSVTTGPTGATVCVWNCGTWKGKTGEVVLSFATNTSSSFYLYADVVVEKSC